MITKELIKSEIDRVRNEYLEPLYRIIKALEETDSIKNQYGSDEPADRNSEWQEFIDTTYGCLSDAPIERGGQGDYEVREYIE